MKPVYQVLAQFAQARVNCLQDSEKAEWIGRHEKTLADIAKEALPHGSGFDNGTLVDVDRSSGDRLVIITQYHRMNDAGMYDGWRTYTVTVKPSLLDCFTLLISGAKSEEEKEYVAQVFDEALRTNIQWKWKNDQKTVGEWRLERSPAL